MEIGAEQEQAGKSAQAVAMDAMHARKALGAPGASESADGPILRTVTADGMAITCYADMIPPFVDAALEQRYASLYSSLAAMTAYDDKLTDTSVFLATRGAEIAILWLFQRQGKTVRVLNESIKIAPDEATCFADWIFASFREVQVITFGCVDTDIRTLRWPLQRQDFSEDSVLQLPSTFDAYLALLGKATRKNISRYTARLKERFPSFRYTVTFGEDIDPAQIGEIVRLNRLRMSLKGKTPGITPADEQALRTIARRHGMLLVATIDGRICAGALVFRLRDNYFSFVRTHDPAYNEYRLGLVGACLMIQECIARGGKELHFMWGREPHKALLKGEERRLFRLTLYRSSAHVLLNLHLALSNLCQACQRRFRVWLVDKMHRDDDIITRVAGSARRLLRRLRGPGG